MTLFPTMIKVALYSDWDHRIQKKIQKKAKKNPQKNPEYFSPGKKTGGISTTVVKGTSLCP